MKRRLKAWASGIAAATLLFSLTACSGNETSGGGETASGGSGGPAYTFSFATIDTEEHPTTLAARKLVEILEEKAPGKFDITVYSNGTLGQAAELVEAIQMGNVDIASPTTSFVANYVPDLSVLDMPYLFGNAAQADAVLDGEIGQSLGEEVNEAGIKFLDFWEVGFRCLANSKRAIEDVEDVAQLRLRIMSNEIQEALFTALGCDPVPMGLSDALVANQQGTIDGMDNPLASLYTTSVYEFDQYIAVTNHTYTTQCIIMSEKAWDSMAEEDQEIFMQAVKEATQFQRETNRSQEAEAVDNLTAKGCEITYPDLSGFAAKMGPVYEQFPEYSDLVAQIQQAASAVQ